MNEQLTQLPKELNMSSETEAPSIRYLTPRQSANLAFPAFYITQGSNDGLDLLFGAVHSILPGLRVHRKSIPRAEEIFGKRVESYLNDSIVKHPSKFSDPLPKRIHHARITSDVVDKQVHGIKNKRYPGIYKFPSVIRRLAGKLDRPDARKPEEAIDLLIDDITKNDKKFLRRPEGRLRKGNSGHLSDGWYSILIRHAVLSQSTGVAEYDLVFRLIAEQLRKKGGPDQEIIELYNQHHPGAQVDVTAWLSQGSGNGNPHSDQTPREESL
jgi:hypothetical protein